PPRLLSPTTPSLGGGAWGVGFFFPALRLALSSRRAAPRPPPPPPPPPRAPPTPPPPPELLR
ncbi:hypothetical protein, partial [Nocardia cyriacigeorgica]|uniref:hypothetical protein n=1 Tax=Nocardia cyriacigeorgica TaxID=135487 RepID=UPI0024586EBC